MPRQAAFSVENNFRNGLITEATALNFPENACTETFDCEFLIDGSVQRRLGFDFENEYQTKPINRTGKAVTTYLWRNVAGNGDVTVLVVQVGLTFYFYEISSDNSFSSGAVASTVTISALGGASPETVEAQYTDGNGFLFITHAYCEPTRVSYDISTHIATKSSIIIKIRDFEGATADPYTVMTRPTTTYAAMDINHAYNLYNQGWSVNNLGAWDAAQTTMPSNADVMWQFKDSSDNFDASTASINRVTAGNTPAPRGHFIVDAFDIDRDAVAGTSGVLGKTSGYQRPTTSAFYEGRIFYSGVNYVGYNSTIYFSQIIERDDQYGFAYQVNDPTSEDLFNLLPSDGGVINIPGAGTIHKLFTVPGGLAVFAERGVWFITGSSQIGFAANDYTVQQIANIPSLTASSFVNVAGYPSWWNEEGIYIMSAQGGLPQVQSITLGKIDTFYKAIPLNSRRRAKGIFHYVDGHIRWLYKSTDTNQIDQMYEYDRVLNYNVHTNAFYPWTITSSDVKVNAIVVSELISGNISINDVVDNSGNNVVDSLGNQLIAYSNSGAEDIPFDKYLVSYWDGSTHQFTFASKINSSYIDWFQYDLVERPYSSYFITGYKLRGAAIRKFQNNWLRVFSRTEEPVSYYFQGIWDYATTGSGTGRWSARQLIDHTDTNYSTSSRRLKVRGHGITLQFRVESFDNSPFFLAGWSTYDTANAVP